MIETGRFSLAGQTYHRGRILIIAELSANHRGSLEHTLSLVDAAAAAGADAVKVQTFTADTMTIRSTRPEFRIEGTLWNGRELHELYAEAAMPWEWQPALGARCDELGLHFFSSPFDQSAVNFLQTINVPAFKIASFEAVDLPLIRYAASTGKPLIISTGMATLAEIDDAVTAARSAGCTELALLKCTSAYPAPAGEANLRTIGHLAETFAVAAGLSDHTPGIVVPVVAASLGAVIVEKHFTLRRADGGPDSAFSLEPDEFAAMVAALRVAEQAPGAVQYGTVASDEQSRVYRRSLYVVADMAAGERFTVDNLRSIRPAAGLMPAHRETVLGRRCREAICAGTPLAWELVA